MTATDIATCHRAASLMLAFEQWAQTEGGTGNPYQGETAWQLLSDVAGDDLGRWVRMAHRTIDIAQERRGRTPGSVRNGERRAS